VIADQIPSFLVWIISASANALSGFSFELSLINKRRLEFLIVLLHRCHLKICKVATEGDLIARLKGKIRWICQEEE
jgi:hypothetical protein